jgi:hypothetical protein
LFVEASLKASAKAAFFERFLELRLPDISRRLASIDCTAALFSVLFGLFNEEIFEVKTSAVLQPSELINMQDKTSAMFRLWLMTDLSKRLIEGAARTDFSTQMVYRGEAQSLSNQTSRRVTTRRIRPFGISGFLPRPSNSISLNCKVRR